jgi:hypothetical protein
LLNQRAEKFLLIKFKYGNWRKIKTFITKSTIRHAKNMLMFFYILNIWFQKKNPIIKYWNNFKFN